MSLSKNNFKKIIAIGICISLLAAIFSGCKESTSMEEGDILTQKAIPAEREPITVLVKYAFGINTFEEEVERVFPDIDIVQVGNYTSDMGIDEYASRLEHNDLPDIVMTWPLDVGEEYWEERLLDLSGYDFTSKFNLSMLNDISKDGKLFYLPGPSQVRGIVYNKTLFEENNWQVPTNLDEFIKLCSDIEKTGIRSLQLGLKNSEVLDTAFVGYSYADCFSQPKDKKWIEAYNNGSGKFLDHFDTGLETFQYLVDSNILKKTDLNIDYSMREKMLFSRECAMVEDSVLMARMGFSQTGTTDEFALMPFFNPNDGKDWARLYMVCYIGLNKNLEEPENKKKFDTVLKLMEYISTPEGQEALMGDTGAMFTSLVGVSPPDVPEIEHLIQALKRGRYAIFPQLKNAQQALRDGLTGMVRGELTVQDVGKMVDEQNASPPKPKPPAVLGKATADFTIKDTGSFIADAIKDESGCEIALFLDNGKDGKYNGKGVCAKIYNGDVTTTDIKRIMPDLKYGDPGTLWKTTMTGENLLNALENTITVDNEENNWFYYFSGLKMKYDVTAPQGSRIRSILTSEGKKINPDKVYSVATMSFSIDDKLLNSCEKTDVKISDIVTKSVEEKGTISPANDGRFETRPE